MLRVLAILFRAVFAAKFGLSAFAFFGRFFGLLFARVAAFGLGRGGPNVLVQFGLSIGKLLTRFFVNLARARFAFLQRFGLLAQFRLTIGKSAQLGLTLARGLHEVLHLFAAFGLEQKVEQLLQEEDQLGLTFQRGAGAQLREVERDLFQH